jgi:hypothetical protein
MKDGAHAIETEMFQKKAEDSKAHSEAPAQHGSFFCVAGWRSFTRAGLTALQRCTTATAADPRFALW